MDKSQSKQVLGRAVKEAYKPIFTIKSSPTKTDKDAIEGKFKSSFNSTDTVAKNRANTFFSLWELCDHDVTPVSGKASAVKASVDTPDDKEEQVEIPLEERNPRRRNPQALTGSMGLHYNIQIHLPPTKDIEVYNAIFKSIKEHLVD